MSLLPFLWGYNEKPLSRILDQQFGLGLDDDLLMLEPLRALSRSNHYVRPWRQVSSALHDNIGSSIKSDKGGFHVNLDVQHFSPEEIAVKLVDNYVVVEGKHEEKQDEHGYISRQFVRKYSLPEGCNPDAIESKLSSDGVLSIVAPKKAVENPGERVVAISHTGPVRKEVKATNDIKTEQKPQL